MSEGFELEPYNVPQQSRRDKLRIFSHNEETSTLDVSLMQHLYDSNTHLFQPQNPLFMSSLVKQEGLNLMSFIGATNGLLSSSNTSCSSSSSSSSSHILLDPSSSSSNLNHEDINLTNPLLYVSQMPLRDLDQSLNDGGVTFKPHPLSYTQQAPVSTGQGLSLSLSSHYRNDPMFAVRGLFSEEQILRSSVPLGPFTGYAAVLKGSKFLKPAQQLLEEICDVGHSVCVERNSPLDHEMESCSESVIVDDISFNGGGDRIEHRRKKSRLISMLDEVYRRYKQYYQQMQNVLASFESVEGLGSAAPYTYLALRAMSKHFRCLKNAITEQLQSTSKTLGEEVCPKEESPRFGIPDHGLRPQIPTHSSSILDQPHVWRPQRGLPEHAVSVLRAWLFEHFLHPYPTDTDKQMLAKQTGLSRNQVSNWFINARVRLWKPMVEEIHALEMKQAGRASEVEDRNPNKHGEPSPIPALSSSQQLQDNAFTQDPSSKRCRNQLSLVPDSCSEPVDFSYNNLSSQQHHVGVGLSFAGGNGGVSLTLGLRQNNGAGLSEPMPLDVGHFGLEGDNSAYVMGGFEVQNRHFGRDIGGKLLRDFVG